MHFQQMLVAPPPVGCPRIVLCRDELLIAMQAGGTRHVESILADLVRPSKSHYQSKERHNAIVWGIVSGHAWVYDNAQVFGDAWKKSPLFIIGSRFSLTNCKKGHIQIGCKCETFAWWKKNGPKFAKENGVTPDEIEEYRAYIELFCKVGK
jgi:hypothetical protein